MLRLAKSGGVCDPPGSEGAEIDRIIAPPLLRSTDRVASKLTATTVGIPAPTHGTDNRIDAQAKTPASRR